MVSNGITVSYFNGNGKHEWYSNGITVWYFNGKQAANLAGFRASEDPRFEAGIPDFMNGILNFSIHFNVVHRKVDWRNPKMKSLNSMPGVNMNGIPMVLLW